MRAHVYAEARAGLSIPPACLTLSRCRDGRRAVPIRRAPKRRRRPQPRRRMRRRRAVQLESSCSFRLVHVFHASNSFEIAPWPPPRSPRDLNASSGRWHSWTRTSQTVGTAAGLINAPDLPLAGTDGGVRPVLIDAQAESGRAQLEGHRSPRPLSHRCNVATSQVFDLDHAVRILALEEARSLHRVVLSVAVGARRAVDSDFELSACHFPCHRHHGCSVESNKLIVGGRTHFPIKRSDR
jgi:hypothetical protein